VAEREEESRPRKAILEAATRLFGAQQYHGTTMRDIAREVGVLPGSLYAHIESKQALLLEVVNAAFEPVLQLAEELERSTEHPEARLRAAIVAHVSEVADHRERALVVLHQWRYLTGDEYTAVLKKRRRYQAVFEHIYEQGVAQGVFNPEVATTDAVFTILGAVNWVPEWFSPDGDLTPAEVGTRLADMLLSGLLLTAPARAA
jgi:TetR/AcrR family transcriptional regulator, cholesterol catabolism regulator